jgi:hypothetical protein
MKKLVLIAAVAGLMASCKKEYTCECTVTGGGITTTSSTTATMKKKDAETWCEGNKGSAPGMTYECKLK